jgi:hypothetical protein
VFLFPLEEEGAAIINFHANVGTREILSMVRSMESLLYGYKPQLIYIELYSQRKRSSIRIHEDI